MALVFNGIPINFQDAVHFNGVALTKLIIHGELIWEKTIQHYSRSEPRYYISKTYDEYGFVSGYYDGVYLFGIGPNAPVPVANVTTYLGDDGHIYKVGDFVERIHVIGGGPTPPEWDEDYWKISKIS